MQEQTTTLNQWLVFGVPALIAMIAAGISAVSTWESSRMRKQHHEELELMREQSRQAAMPVLVPIVYPRDTVANWIEMLNKGASPLGFDWEPLQRDRIVALANINAIPNPVFLVGIVMNPSEANAYNASMIVYYDPDNSFYVADFAKSYISSNSSQSYYFTLSGDPISLINEIADEYQFDFSRHVQTARLSNKSACMVISHSKDNTVYIQVREFELKHGMFSGTRFGTWRVDPVDRKLVRVHHPAK